MCCRDASRLTCAITSLAPLLEFARIRLGTAEGQTQTNGSQTRPLAVGSAVVVQDLLPTRYLENKRAAVVDVSIVLFLLSTPPTPVWKSATSLLAAVHSCMQWGSMGQSLNVKGKLKSTQKKY